MGLTMALNGIDFTDPSPKYELDAGSGTYSYRNGEAGWSVSLYWAKDVGPYRAGDKITLDLFKPETFVKNVHVELPSWDDPTGRISWDPGPLAVLIDGRIDFDAKNPLDVGVKLRLRGDLVAIELESVGIHRPLGLAAKDDVFTWRIATLRATVSEIVRQVTTGEGYGVTFEGSRYRSVRYGVEEDFGLSRVMVEGEPGGRAMHLEGSYDATLRVAQGARTFWQRGLVSSRTANRTEYYCDEARTRRLGVATHALELDRGTFVLDAGGISVPYGLDQLL